MFEVADIYIYIKTSFHKLLYMCLCNCFWSNTSIDLFFLCNWDCVLLLCKSSPALIILMVLQHQSLSTLGKISLFSIWEVRPANAVLFYAFINLFLCIWLIDLFPPELVEESAQGFNKGKLCCKTISVYVLQRRMISSAFSHADW